MGKRVNKRVIVATLFKDDGTFCLTQELATYRHRTEVAGILKAISNRINSIHKCHSHHLFFMDEEEK